MAHLQAQFGAAVHRHDVVLADLRDTIDHGHDLATEIRRWRMRHDVAARRGDFLGEQQVAGGRLAEAFFDQCLRQLVVGLVDAAEAA